MNYTTMLLTTDDPETFRWYKDLTGEPPDYVIEAEVFFFFEPADPPHGIYYDEFEPVEVNIDGHTRRYDEITLYLQKQIENEFSYQDDRIAC